jgi:hypothetical protein
MTGKVAGPKGIAIDVHVDAAAFANSVHGGLNCTNCHVTFTSEPHMAPQGKVPSELAALVPYTSVKAKVDPVALAACKKCHATEYNEVKSSVHGRNIFEKKEADAPLCLDCHGNPHYIRPKDDPESKISHFNVLETCGRCHEDEKIVEKYGLSPHVIEKYKESFHGKKYLLGHKRVPICSDCHGGHYIMEAGAPGSPTFGEGKVRTCGKCHEGATAKFAAAPAHKYIGKENPIPFYGEKALIILVFGVFIFTISHVLLESWAEIRDHVFRKEDKEGRHE